MFATRWDFCDSSRSSCFKFCIVYWFWLHEELINKWILDLTHFKWVLLMAFHLHLWMHLCSWIFLSLTATYSLQFLGVPQLAWTLHRPDFHTTLHSKVREPTESPYIKGWCAVSEELLKLLPQGWAMAFPSEDLILFRNKRCDRCLQEKCKGTKGVPWLKESQLKGKFNLCPLNTDD